MWLFQNENLKPPLNKNLLEEIWTTPLNSNVFYDKNFLFVCIHDLPTQGEILKWDKFPNRLYFKGSLIKAVFQGLSCMSMCFYWYEIMYIFPCDCKFQMYFTYWGFSPYAYFISANFITAIFQTFHKYLPYANFGLFISLVQFFGQKNSTNEINEPKICIRQIFG